MSYTKNRIYVEASLTADERHQLKVRAVAEDSSIKAIVAKAIRIYLRSPIDKRDKQS
jgi:hypothetical protein